MPFSDHILYNATGVLYAQNLTCQQDLTKEKQSGGVNQFLNVLVFILVIMNVHSTMPLCGEERYNIKALHLYLT